MDALRFVIPLRSGAHGNAGPFDAPAAFALWQAAHLSGLWLGMYSPKAGDVFAWSVAATVALVLLHGLRARQRLRRAQTARTGRPRAGAPAHAASLGEAELERRVVERTEDLTRARDEAQQASLAKTRFLAAASHDLRQPMHAIGLLVGALRDRVAEPGARQLVDRIERSVEALGGLFDALLDISKIDSGAVVPSPRTVRLDDLFARIELALTPDAQAKGLRLRVRRSRALVRSDPVLLERLLRNLVVNAIRYTAHGSVLLSARVRGASLRIEVRDSGIGIAPDQQAIVFDEFVRLAGPMHDRARGYGLGLSIVRRLAMLLQHDLSLRSAPGRGSTFTVTVPRLGHPVHAPADPQTPSVDLTGIFVVAIDDEPDVLEGTTLLLQQAGARVLAARSGHDALQRLEEHLRTPDLIVSDWRLAPKHTGLDAISLLRDAFATSIPALLVTGDCAPEDLRDMRATGLPVLFEPVAADMLCEAVACGLLQPRPANPPARATARPPEATTDAGGSSGHRLASSAVARPLPG